MSWKTSDGSTGRLVQLCTGYFLCYVATGLIVKFFTGSIGARPPRMDDIAFLAFNTLGANLVCLVPVLVLGWWRMPTIRPLRLGALSVPSELLYIVPSGICTAVVIPTTTLMYSLPISVMVAMVIMRAAVIVIGRLVDAIQIAQGILVRRVYAEENVAVVLAIIAASIELFGGNGNFDFLGNRAAVIILTSYIAAYAIRIYIMNYYKNTRPRGTAYNNKGFFALEQISASITMALAVGLLLHAARSWPSWARVPQLAAFASAVHHPPALAWWAAVAGSTFGLVAFFSVFIFMFKGRTATFTGLVNRLTSLVAGTAATLLGALLFHSRFPSLQNWVSLGFILAAVSFLTRAERRRAQELRAEKVI